MTRLIFSPTEKHWFFHLAIVTTLIALTVIVFSAYANLQGVPPACHHWPLCRDSWIAMTHRLILLLSAISIGAMTIGSLFAARHFSFGPFLISVVIIPFIVLEIFLNKWIMLHPTTIYLFVSQAVLQLLVVTLSWWICKIVWPHTYDHAHSSLKRMRPWVWIGLVLLWLEVICSSVLNVQAAPSNCMIFPYCHHQLQNLFHFQSTLAFLIDATTHRYFTLPYFNFYHKIIEICMLTYLSILGFLLLFNRFIFQKAFYILLLVSIQVCLGFLNVKSHYHIAILLTHDIVACLLLLAVISLLISLHNKPRDLWYE